MLTLVQIQSPSVPTSSADTASLVADYLAFDRQRTSRRQYMKAFGGMAILVLLGARVRPRRRSSEAWIVAGLLVATAAVRSPPSRPSSWHRLVRRLDRLRAEVQTVRKS